MRYDSAFQTIDTPDSLQAEADVWRRCARDVMRMHDDLDERSRLAFDTDEMRSLRVLADGFAASGRVAQGRANEMRRAQFAEPPVALARTRYVPGGIDELIEERAS